MQKYIIAAALLTVGITAQAQTNSQAVSNTQSTANSAAQNAGNAQSIKFVSHSPDSVKTTPSVGGQGFYGSFSPDSCTVSAGGGVSGGFVGINVAAPIDMKSCVALRGFERTMQASVTFQGLGDAMTAARLRQSAIDMLCQVSDEVKQALAYQGLCSDFNKQYAIAPPMPVILATPQVAQTMRGRINADGTVTYE